MSPLVETVRIEGGKVFNLPGHQARMNRSLHALGSSILRHNLESRLRDVSLPVRGLFKCRVVYTDTTMDIEIVPYEVRPVTSLKMIRNDEINYPLKLRDRELLNSLFELRMDCDDILIIKKGYVTDSSYANIVFKLDNKWFTPSPCLLRGTQRQLLLDIKKIAEVPINASDVRNFTSFKLINSMMQFDGPEIPVQNIIN